MFISSSESCASTVCGACEKARAKTMLQLFGQPYNTNTLASLPPDQDAMINRVSVIRVPGEYIMMMMMMMMTP